jgi:putative DNA primase/helicase
MTAPSRDSLALLRFPRTDYGNAERLVHAHGDDLRYCAAMGWLHWTGQRWEIDQTGEITRRAKDTIRKLLPLAKHLVVATEEEEKERAQFIKFVRGSENNARIEAMIELAKTEPRIAIEAKQLDADPWRFNCSNCTIDLRTGEPFEHDRSDLITKLAPVAYDPDAQAPRWLDFLREVMGGKDDLIEYVRRVFGYALTGDVSEHVFFILHGTGANGKSVLVRVLASLAGDYSKTISPDVLVVQPFAQHPTALAEFFGCRVAVASEIEGRAAEAQLKALTGGDRITARRMRQDFFEFNPTHKLFITANYIPEIKGTDHGIWRRLHVIPFEVTIPPERRDPHLAEHLIKNELPGILHWALGGLRDWRTRGGLSPPEAVLEHVNECRVDADPLAGFMESCCYLAKGGQEAAKDLLVSYRSWCSDAGEVPISSKAFGSNLLGRGLRRKMVNGYPVYEGIRLRVVG